ncbi:MAG: hypothetical protein WBC92_10765 [Terracidiphilus sp.]
MNTNVSAASGDLAVKTAWRHHLVEARHPMSRSPVTHLAVVSRNGLTAYATNAIFCLSLWMSLFIAIWLTKGWIGLLLSGQVLCAGTHLFEILTKRTHYAFSATNGQAHELESERNA